MKSDFHILLAPDSFKGSLRSVEVCRYLKNGLSRADPNFRITELPLADGGEGTVQALVEASGGRYCQVNVHDPLMRLVEAQYGLIHNDQVAVIEMAAASGLELLDRSEYNPVITTTFGTGELIMDALNKGCKKFIVGIGGSATNDGGAGMLEYLGVKLHSDSGRAPGKGGGDLNLLSWVDFSTLDDRLQDCSFQIACDVTNPLTGPEGATYVYGPQKGAGEKELAILENGLSNWGSVLEKATGRDIIHVPGAGAAGGLGAGFLSLPNVEIKSGFDIIQQAIDLESRVINSDLIITGEGRVDSQTIYGKVVSGVGRLGKKHQKPVVCLAGTLGADSQKLLEYGITALFSIVNGPISLEEAIETTPLLLENSGVNLGNLIAALSIS
ncbi:MAG TPA: glycerate kinase [Membranihabitans sp.]|nr:glycerate kinase [Membranihabitans sp.]